MRGAWTLAWGILVGLWLAGPAWAAGLGPLQVSTNPEASLAGTFPDLDSRPSPDLALPRVAPIGLFGVGQLGGASEAVAIAGDRVFVGSGPRLVVWGLDAGGRPERLAQSAPLPGLVKAVAVDEDHAFVLCAGDAQGLPSLTLVVLAREAAGELPLRAERSLPGSQGHLAVGGAWLWIALREGGLALLDTRRPEQAGALRLLPIPAFATQIEGSGAWVAGEGSLMRFEIDDPAGPRLVADHPIGLPLQGLALIEAASAGAGPGGRHLVLLAKDLGGLLVYAVDGLDGVPRFASFLSLGLREAARIAAAGSQVFVSLQQGVAVVDLSDPTAPVWLGTVGPPFASVAGLAAARGRLWLATGEAGAWSFALEPGALPRQELQLPALATVRHLAAAGPILYLAGGPTGLWTVDVGDPAHPRLLGHLPLWDLRKIRLRPPYAYAACGRAGLFVLDIRDPSAPAVVGLFKTPDEATDVAVADAGPVGAVAFVAGARSGLRVADLQEPAAPRFVGAVEDLGGEPEALALSGNLLYVAAGAAGLQVFEVSDPARPRLIASRTAPEDATALALAGDTLYVGYRDRALRAFDLRDPEAPRARDSMVLPGLIDLSPVDGGLAVARVGAGAGLLAWDAAGRLAPASVAAWAGGSSLAVAESGRHWFVAAGPLGLQVLERRPLQQLWLPIAGRAWGAFP